MSQNLRDAEPGQWVEVKGHVMLVRERPDGWQMELSADAGRAQVEAQHPLAARTVLRLDSRKILPKRERGSALQQPSNFEVG